MKFPIRMRLGRRWGCREGAASFEWRAIGSKSSIFMEHLKLNQTLEGPYGFKFISITKEIHVKIDI